MADGSGGHAFSETLKDHNANVQKWRAGRKGHESQDGSGSRPPEADRRVPAAGPRLKQRAHGAAAKSAGQAPRPPRAERGRAASAAAHRGEQTRRPARAQGWR